MGMFDNLRVHKPLPLNEELSQLNIKWDEEIFQTKDLENFLELYEITKDGKLKFLRIEREWEKDPNSPFGGHLKAKSENWELVPFHGVIRFYTSICDNPKFIEEVGSDGENLSWDEIFKTNGNDWWIEFLAIFNQGELSELRLEKTERTPISARLASNKEWKIKRDMRAQEPLNKIVGKLKKFPIYRTATRTMSRWEQKLHEKVSKILQKIS